MTGPEIKQANKPPELGHFLAAIPDEGRLEYLRDTLSDRAGLLSRSNDPESRAWSSLYSYMVTELECALIAHKAGITL